MEKTCIAHISDLHFGRPTLNPLQFLSKRWLGNLNLLLKRKRQFDHSRLSPLPQLFKEKGVTHVVISGDVSVTARRREFALARKYAKEFESLGMTTMVIPGNHDHYTRYSDKKKIFYKFFPSQWHEELPFNLVDHKVTGLPLSENLWLLALDTALATSLISSQGLFSALAEEYLEEALKKIPSTARVILVNHFPFFQHEPPTKQMMRGPILKNLLSRHRNVRLYMHGHTHREALADLSPSNLPLIVDSGSTPHNRVGSFHILTPDEKEIEIETYHFDGQWQSKKSHRFKW